MDNLGTKFSIPVFSVFLLIGMIGYSQCKTKSYVREIYEDVLTNYTKAVLPVVDHTKPLFIGIKFYLSAIHKFSEIDETLTISGSVTMNWTDPGLTWDPSSHGNVYVTVVDASEIWTPPFMLTNTADKMETVGGDSKFNAMIVYNGEIYYSAGDLFEVKCSVDIANFPFDEQYCSLYFMAWGIPPDYLDFISLSEKAGLDYFYPNADWTLKDCSTRLIRTNHIVMYEVTLNLKRSSLYYGIMVIAPTILFAMMNPLVFMLPIESGERVGLAMTILLSYAIFLTIVSSSIPATSNPMCVLLIVMVVVIFVSAVIVFGVILSFKYFNVEDPDKIGSCFKCLARICSNKKAKLKYTEDNTDIISGKDVSDFIDSLFFYGSYVVMFTVIIGYGVFSATHEYRDSDWSYLTK